MRILEVRDGIIKFESDKKILLSSFLQINDCGKKYIAQVIQVKKTEENFISFAKILFLYDGTLKNYDKTLPAKDAEITEFTFDIINKTLEYITPIIAGKFIDGDIDIPVDADCFNKKMLISVDSQRNKNVILSNLAKQFENSGNVLVIDMLGTIEGPKYIAGNDFKLPLNTGALEFMYEDCLNDATSDSKSLIKEIFKDLSDYSKTVPFLPFGTLKSIVDDMVDKSHVFKLLVLKNKLAKFDKLGYFAATSHEAENLSNILNSKYAVIDLSKLDSVFQNRYLSSIYSLLESKSSNTQVFIEASNALNKKNIKNILTNETIPAVFMTHSRFKYINEMKSMFDNFIIEPSFTNNETFKIYSTFLNSMPKDTYLLVGEGTNYIPFVSEFKNIEIEPVQTQKSDEQNIIIKEESSNDIEEEAEEEEEQQPVSFEETNELIIEEEFNNIEENPELETPDEAIEKKSEEFIEKVAEEIETTGLNENINLFGEEDDDIESSEETFDETLEELQNDEIIEPEIIREEIIEEQPLSSSSAAAEEEEEEENEEENVGDENTISEIEPEEITEDSLEQEIDQEETIEALEVSEEFHTEVDEIQTIEIPEDISDMADELDSEEEEKYSEDITEEFAERMEIEPDEIGLREYSEEKDFNLNEEPEVLSLTEDNDDEFDEIIELDESEAADDDIIVDLEDDEENSDSETLDKQIVEDVDKVFTTIKEDSISDSDLDFIDELNSDTETEESEELSIEGTVEELPELVEEDSEEGFLEPLEEAQNLEQIEDKGEILETKKTNTPIVPVYDADIPQEDMVMSDTIEQGDTVVHAKHGVGVVEKMIKYGTKTLYSINFDNVGRRLLDPTLTEIKKA